MMKFLLAFGLAVTYFSFKAAESLKFTGFFENHHYNKVGKNDWHYVTITKSSSGSYTWQNQAGVKWTLYPHSKNALRVGRDCPYYNSGFRYANFTNEGVLGNAGELYKREECKNRKLHCSIADCNSAMKKGECALTCNICCKAFADCCKFTGYFENHEFDKGGKTDWHYVTITKSLNDSYIWRNAAAVQWALYPDDEYFLKVGSDSPNYREGHYYARFLTAGVHGPWMEFYKRKTCADRKAFCSSADCNDVVKKGECAATCKLCFVDFTGYYENHQYDKGGKNTSHFVTIIQNKDGKSFTWKNEAGRNWTIHPHNGNTLRVGIDSPYYMSGHRYAQFNATGVRGPGNEFYKKEDCSNRQTSCSLASCAAYDVYKRGDCALTCGLCARTRCNCKQCAN